MRKFLRNNIEIRSVLLRKSGRVVPCILETEWTISLMKRTYKLRTRALSPVRVRGNPAG